MDITIDLSELQSFATATAQAPGILREELAGGLNAGALVGVGLAQDYAPVDESTLKNAITIIDSASSGDLTASYGPQGIVYAAQREFGGPIFAKPGGWLVWPDPKGGVDAKGRPAMIFAKKVMQEGSFYMKKSRQEVEPRVREIMQAAVDRAIARMGMAAD